MADYAGNPSVFEQTYVVKIITICSIELDAESHG